MNFDLVFQNKMELKKHQLSEFHKYLLKKQGWIYIAKTKDHPFLKIGRTSKTPMHRAQTLSSTGVLSDYEIVFSVKVFNQFLVEKNIHYKLNKNKVSKEFFAVSLNHAIEVIQSFYEKEKTALEKYFDYQILTEDLDLIHYAYSNANKKNQTSK